MRTPTPIRPVATGARGALAAFAARRDTARALLIGADAAAVSLALGVAVQLGAGAQLRPAALLAIPSVVLLARVFGLYERLGRGLGRSTLTDLPRQFQLATLYTLPAISAPSAFMPTARDDARPLGSACSSCLLLGRTIVAALALAFTGARAVRRARRASAAEPIVRKLREQNGAMEGRRRGADAPAGT